MALFDKLTQNAMLYKDTTQWLRNRTFLTLFMGLLASCEVICVFIASLPAEEGSHGPWVFIPLCVLLFIYLLIIGLMGFALTGREFMNQTFELFELSGMTLEKMVLGKLFSMLSQFYFGFFCIVPFMFFSFLLGGIDFYLILTIVLSVMIITPPLYEISLLTALSSKNKAISTIVKLGALVLLVAILIAGIFYMVWIFSPFPGSNEFTPVTIVKNLTRFDGETWFWFSLGIVIYAQLCAWVFYLLCQMVSPITDSREVQIKFVSFTLCSTWIVMFAYLFKLFGPDDGAAFWCVIPVGLMMLLNGIIFFYSRLEVPIMVRNRQANASWFAPKFLHYWFQPGPWGTFRSMLLQYAVIVVFIFYCHGVVSKIHSNPTLEIYGSVPLTWLTQIPFFIAFPASFFLLFRLFNRDRSLVSMKIGIFSWWIIWMILLSIGLSVSWSFSFGGTSGFFAFFEFLGILLTPLVSIYVGLSNSSAFNDLAIIRTVLGIIGFFVLLSSLRKREKMRAELEQEYKISIGVASEEDDDDDGYDDYGKDALL